MNLPEINLPHPAEALLLARIPLEVRERAARVPVTAARFAALARRNFPMVGS